MNEQIKSNLTTAYLMFVFDFADPSFDKGPLLEKLGVDLAELFDKQKSVDHAKKEMSKDDFQKILSLYFNQFQSGDGLAHSQLADKLEAHKANFQRHLGKDKLAYLGLILKLMKTLEVKKRGLLAA